MEGEGGIMAPGYRFYPTEEELVTFYLKHKIQKSPGTTRLLQEIDRVIPQFHINDFYPWDLPQYAGERCRGDPEQWFFFVPRQENEARGGRISRLTSSGYWKATGSPSIVYSSGNRGIGVKRTMVFYTGRAPTGKKTKWKLNEYKAFEEQHSSNTNSIPELMQELSLCRVYIKSNCLRAFDRRPSGVVIRESRTLHQTHDNGLHATTSTHLIPPSIMGRTCDDHSYVSSEEQNTNSCSIMEVMDQPLWDWEEHHNYL